MQQDPQTHTSTATQRPSPKPPRTLSEAEWGRGPCTHMRWNIPRPRHGHLLDGNHVYTNCSFNRVCLGQKSLKTPPRARCLPGLELEAGPSATGTHRSLRAPEPKRGNTVSTKFRTTVLPPPGVGQDGHRACLGTHWPRSVSSLPRRPPENRVTAVLCRAGQRVPPLTQGHVFLYKGMWSCP